MPKYKCIGGFLDGQFIDVESSELTKYFRQREPMPNSLRGAFDVVSDVAVTRGSGTWYTRRSIHSEGRTVYYYSPENWTDYQTILHMLS